MSNGKKDLISDRADKLVFEVYKVTNNFPQSEIFGLTSQLRRAALSIILNITEGYARQQRQDHRRFLEIAYGSTKETMYLLNFSVRVGYATETKVADLISGYDELARMLWSKIQTLKTKK